MEAMKEALEKFILALVEYDRIHGTWYAYYLNGMPMNEEPALVVLFEQACRDAGIQQPE